MWATWLVAVIGEENLVQLLEELGVGVLLYHNTTGCPEDEIDWAKPEEFERAATILGELVAARDKRVSPLIDTYRLEWDQLIGKGEDGTAEEWLIQDLRDVAGIGRYARSQGAKKMTLGYYW